MDEVLKLLHGAAEGVAPGGFEVMLFPGERGRVRSPNRGGGVWFPYEDLYLVAAMIGDGDRMNSTPESVA